MQGWIGAGVWEGAVRTDTEVTLVWALWQGSRA